MTKLHRFLLPVRTNNGALSYEKAREKWLEKALAFAGGYTDYGQVSGVWQGSHGVIKDELWAIDVGLNGLGVELLKQAFFDLFHDQLALAVACGENLTVIDRTEWSLPDKAEAEEIGRYTESPSGVALALPTDAIIEADAGRLRAAVGPLVAASWRLDAAISAVRKDRAAYRRGNSKGGSAGANAVPGELETAYFAALKILFSLEA